MSDLQHVLIIPDGNRRWAKQKGLAAFLGHETGAENLEEILGAALDLKIPCLTFWGSSLDNVTKRPKEEVDFLFGVFEKYFTKLLADEKINKEGVRVSVLGRWQEFFPKKLEGLINEVVAKTKNNNRHNLTFLMAYSGKDEITNAIQEIAQLITKNSKLKVDEELIKENLWTKELPAVDLVIRTGGEPHWSAGVMMWDVADAQLYFTKTLWPDFSKEEFERAVGDYSGTERRFGR